MCLCACMAVETLPLRPSAKAPNQQRDPKGNGSHQLTFPFSVDFSGSDGCAIQTLQEDPSSAALGKIEPI